MNKFLVFAYFDIFPSGGMDDCVFKTNDYATALNVAKEFNQDIVYVYHTKRDKIIWRNNE